MLKILYPINYSNKININLTSCFLYSPAILSCLIEHYVPKIKQEEEKRGFILKIDNEEFLSTNTSLAKAVQNFILSTKRVIATKD